MPSNWAMVALGGHRSTAVGGCSRVESEPSRGHQKPTWADPANGCRGKLGLASCRANQGKEKVVKDQNMSSETYEDDRLDENSMVRLTLHWAFDSWYQSKS